MVRHVQTSKGDPEGKEIAGAVGSGNPRQCVAALCLVGVLENGERSQMGVWPWPSTCALTWGAVSCVMAPSPASSCPCFAAPLLGAILSVGTRRYKPFMSYSRCTSGTPTCGQHDGS